MLPRPMTCGGSEMLAEAEAEVEAAVEAEAVVEEVSSDARVGVVATGLAVHAGAIATSMIASSAATLAAR